MRPGSLRADFIILLYRHGRFDCLVDGPKNLVRAAFVGTGRTPEHVDHHLLSGLGDLVPRRDERRRTSHPILHRDSRSSWCNQAS